MTALASGDVSISLPPRNREIVRGTKVVSMVRLTFGDGALTYPAGGVPLPAIGNFGMKKALELMLIQQPAGSGYVYRFDDDDCKIKILTVGEASFETQADAGVANTVVHAAIPAGNEVYLKYNSSGQPYLCCNMATDTENKLLAFGDYNVVVIHDASASGGDQVYFDEDGAAGEQLLTINSETAADAYVAADVPGYYLKVAHDASADSNGVAVKYDDDTSEKLEALFAGEEDVDLALSVRRASSGATFGEIPSSTAPAEVTLPVLVIGE